MSTVVITGASDGIGLEASSQLAAQGHDVVMVGRNPQKLAAAVDRVRSESPAVSVASYVCDFASLGAVRRLAEQLLDACPRIDVLVNNAGTVFDKRTLTVDGHESTWAVNHLAPFLLTELLRERLVASAPARIVTTASVGHRMGRIDLDDPGFEGGGYQIMRAYGRSKLANILTTRVWSRQLAGSSVTATCFHPGTVATNIWGGAPWFARPVLAVAKLRMDSPAKGGRRITYLATDPAVEGASGGYYEKDREVEPSETARDDVLAQRLYDASRAWVGLD